MINTICDNAMLIGFASDSKTISPEIIHEVVSDLGLSNGRRLQSRTQTSSAKPHPTGGTGPNGDHTIQRDSVDQNLKVPPIAQQAAEAPKDKAGSPSGSRDDSESMALFMQFVGTLRDRANQTKKD